MSFLLESVEGGAARGRYSVIGLEPDLVWRAEGDKAAHQPQPDRQAGRFRLEPQANARLVARPLEGIAARSAAGAAPHVGRHLRLHGL